MGFGAMLYRDFLGLDKVVFGTILEAYLEKPDLVFGADDQFFPVPGFGLIRKVYVGGLTEVATAFLCEYFAPEVVDDSLRSVAAVGSTKYYRKQLLIHLAKIKYGKVHTPMPAVCDVPAKPLTFGEYIADDFLSFYVRKRLGSKAVDALCCDMPPDAIHLCDTLSLRFYERVLPDLVNLCTPGETEGYYAKLAEAGIGRWDDTDWAEFSQVLGVLRKYHPEVVHVPRRHRTAS